MGVTEWVPGIGAARGYRAPWFPKDLMAGIVLTTLLVPQGMAYAELAGLPPITGLYTSILCLLAYAVFGPSRVLVLGPDSALGPMIAAVVVPMVVSGGDPAQAVAMASVLALLVGLFMTVAAVAKLGFVADLLSHPTQLGYVNGLAVTIFFGQLPKLFGFSVEGDGLFADISGFVTGLGETVPAAVAIGGGGLLVILLLQRLLPKVPAILVAVVGAIGAVTVLDLDVDVVGPLPRGFPPFTIPTVSWDELGILAAAAVGITLVSVTDTISTATTFAARTGQEVRGNQEMAGIGAANLAAGLFQGFPVSTSGSRTAVAFAAGAKSQVTGLVGAVAITLMLVLVPGLLKDMPQPMLAAVVIAASIGLADIKGMVRLYRQRRIEFALAVAAFVGVAVVGVLPGIAVAVGLSVLNVFRRAWWPYRAVLGKPADVDGYHDLRQYPDAAEIPALAIFRFDAPLIFANARTFREEIRHLAITGPRWILVAAEPITDVDTTAADMLEELDQELNAKGISLVFAEMKNPVKRKIDRYGLTGTIDPAHFYPTLDDAVAAFRRSNA
ncbi:sulfate permease [Actinoplanes sp. LDG1-06]|uniref:Sulfate permease n=1 Tax=Paractinoplanes ovalisporus TaxID=2810368 RepID=A0ABS2AMN9_9ACTN|nr:sulfate permease [Actinoplanes ovalisporus]MBM2621048.1 sulfate permease [Actinoplanes ovalisporus]